MWHLQVTPLGRGGGWSPRPAVPRRPSPPETSPGCSRCSRWGDTVAGSRASSADCSPSPREPPLQRQEGGREGLDPDAGPRTKVASQPFLRVQREWRVGKPRAYPCHRGHASSHQLTFIERLLYAPCSPGIKFSQSLFSPPSDLIVP